MSAQFVNFSCDQLSVDDNVEVGGDIDVAGALTVTGTATQTGLLTFGTMPLIPTATVAAAGSSQTDATAIATGLTVVTDADAAKGVKLPTAVAGQICIVKNNANAVLKLYPNTSDKINGGAANAEFSGGLAAYTAILLVAYDATDWYTVPLADS